MDVKKEVDEVASVFSQPLTRENSRRPWRRCSEKLPAGLKHNKFNTSFQK